jgi:prophage tail gpP-like protein
MKVTSPIGELPFVVRGVSLHDGHVVVEGELGAWRSRIEVGAEDLPMLGRALRGPLIAAGLCLAGIALLRRR